jgi:polysaccharide biosynthesis protein PslH
MPSPESPTMADVLFLAQRIPFPPVKGDKIRSANVLKHLAARHRVFCGAFVDDPEDWRHAEALKPWCADLCLVPLDRRRATLRSLAGLATGQALTVPYYRDARLAAWVAAVLRDHHPASAYLFSSAMAQYVVGRPDRPPRVIMDFVDVDSQKWSAYAQTRRWPLSWVYRREAAALLRHDRAVAAQVEASLLVSPAEAALFRRLAPEAAERTVAMTNGVDTAFFDPAPPCPSPFAAGPPVVFTGAMDYWPNIDAVTWFAREVLPILRREVAVDFIIVGANPPPAVLSLRTQEGVLVTGRVPDVRPYLAHAAAVVAPLGIARGIQNKVLEAMAMARPVVVTPEALEGISARPGVELLLAAREPDAFAAATAAALASGSDAMGRAARELVCRAYSWPGALAVLDDLLAEGPPAVPASV